MNDTHRILFERPDLPQLTRTRTVVDMHFHSKYSDGTNTVAEIADYARKLGIGIAITDHNEIQGAVELNQIKDVLNIPGIEVTSKEGTHVLVYFYQIKSLVRFYRRDIAPHMGADVMSSTSLKMETIIARAQKYDALVIFPHPSSAAYTGVVNPYFPEKRRQKLFDMADGVEVINAANLNIWNMQSALLGFNLQKAITGGSDGHCLNYMGRAVTYADCPAKRRCFMDALKKKEHKVVGKEIDIIRKVASNGVKFRTNFKNTPDLVEKNLRYSYAYLQSKSKRLRENFRRSLNGRMKKSA
jgi:predicted metal-dependent phosphoesterase TrpH